MEWPPGGSAPSLPKTCASPISAGAQLPGERQLSRKACPQLLLVPRSELVPKPMVAKVDSGGLLSSARRGPGHYWSLEHPWQMLFLRPAAI